MSVTHNPGRDAGILYLLLAVLGPIRLLYIPAALFVSGDAAATARNIVASELTFRLGIVSELAAGVTVLFLTFALYRLFSGVSRDLSVLVVVLGGVLPATIDFLLGVNDAAALMLARGDVFLSAFSEQQRQALAMLFLRLHHHQVLAAEILWGLWLFPLALLIWRSRFMPRFLGVWLLLNGAAYLVVSLTGLLAPSYEDTVGTFAMPALLGEIAVMLWLVFKGAKPLPAAATAPAAGS